MESAAATIDPYAPRPGATGAMLRHVAQLLARNIWLIAAIIAAALAIGVVATMLTTPQYAADAAIQIEDERDTVLGNAVDGLQDPTPDWDVDRLINTQLEVLRSRELARRVARKLKLDRRADFADAVSASTALGEPAAIAALRAHQTLEMPDNSRIVRIGFSTARADISAELANAYAEELIAANLRRRFDSTAYARSFVAEQMEEARARLEGSERALNDYARGAGLIRPAGETGSGSVTGESLAQLNEAANRAEADRIAAESRWQAERNAPLLSSRAAQASPAVQQLVARQAELETQLQSARERYLPDHPTVQRLETELATTRSAITRNARTARAGVQAEYIAARDAERQLAERVSQLRGETLAEQDRSVRYNTLAREADTNRQLYQGLLERYRGLNAASGIAASNIAIIDRAEPPDAPYTPNLLRNLLMALAVGLGFAALAVFLRDQLDDTIRLPEDVEDKTGLPLLGVVPVAAGGDPLAEMAEETSGLAEAYNALRGSLMFASAEGHPPILLVTSSQPGEGKSVTSAALATALAKLGRKTLLVDADLRRPGVHRAFGMDNSAGLSSVLVDASPLEQAVRASAQPNLSVLTSGPVPPDPTRLIGGPRMAALLEQLSAQYDAVVLDSSPVLGLADAPMLASISDAVLFVIEADRGRSGSLKTALRRLRAANAQIAGAVLTKFDPARAGNRYSSYSGENYYRYGSADA